MAILRAAVSAAFLVAVPCLGAPLPPSPPRPAPVVSWVVPPLLVGLDCPGVESSRSWVATLGGALDERGFRLVRTSSATRPESLSVVVKCAAPATAAAPAPAASAEAPAPAAAPAPAEAPAPAAIPTTTTASATSAPAVAPAATAPEAPVVPVVELDSPPSDAHALAAADRVAERFAPATGFPRPARVLFLVEDSTDTGRALLLQTSWVVTYARLGADFANVSRLDRLPARWLDGYDSVILATDRLPRTGVQRLARDLIGYVDRGGSVVAVGGVDDDDLFPLFGIRKASGDVAIRTYGCDGSFWPGATGLDPVLEEGAEDIVPRFQLAKDTRVLCRGAGDGARDVPLAFTARRGKGTTLAWAGAALNDKSARGRLLLSLLEVDPVPAAILGALVFYADDCPLPMTNDERSAGDAQPAMTDSDFYLNLWWPRMQALLQKHAIRPTAGFILTYDDRMPDEQPPENYSEPDGEPSLRLARQVRDAGWEVGLHGYNHQSLSVGKNEWTVGWSGRADMESALRFLRVEYQRIFGADAEPPVYVAPSNFIQKMGKESLRAIFPSIRGIASQYQDEGPILGQEFGPDPDVPGLVDLPRISSEHFLDGANSGEILDALVLPGIFSHFVHPDDFFDPERSRGADFDEMVRRLDGMLSVVDHAYPFLQRLTASELARYVPQWRKARLEVLRDASGVSIRAIDPPPNGLPILLRAPRGSTVETRGACVETFRAPSESRYYYRVGSETCAITWH